MRCTLLPSAGRAALPHLQILPRGETTEQWQEQPRRHKLRPPPSHSLSEMFQQHTQGHQLLLSPSGGERRMLETMAESHVKILTECSLQLSLGDVLPASPYGKHGHVSGQGKSFGHAGFAPCMVSKHKPPALPLAIQGNKAGTFCTGAQSRRDLPELGGVLSAGSARQHTQRLRVTGYAET